MLPAQRIILLEDDPLQAEWIAEQVIWKESPDADVRYFDSEHSFLEAIRNSDLQNWDPQYALIDLLVRYYSPEDLVTMDAVPDFDDLPSPMEAGVRCHQALLEACPQTKIAIVTVLDERPENCTVIQKGNDELPEMLTAFLKQ